MNQNHLTIPLYMQIAEDLLGRIKSGQLTSGDRLPSERELSESIGVNRRTLREALRLNNDWPIFPSQKKSNTPVSTSVYYVYRLKLLNNHPNMLEKFTLPQARFPDFEKS